MTPISVEITYSAKDLQKSYEINYSIFYPVRSKVLLIFGCLLALIGGILSFLSYLVPDAQSIWLGKLYLVIGILCVAVHFWKLKNLGKRMLKKLPDLLKPYQFTIHKDGIQSKSANVNSEVSWAYYQNAVVTDDIIILYINPLRFSFFPKDRFNDHDFEQFCALVRKNVKPIKWK